jgi:hypothetical protein
VQIVIYRPRWAAAAAKLVERSLISIIFPSSQQSPNTAFLWLDCMHECAITNRAAVPAITDLYPSTTDLLTTAIEAVSDLRREKVVKKKRSECRALHHSYAPPLTAAMQWCLLDPSHCSGPRGWKVQLGLPSRALSRPVPLHRLDWRAEVSTATTCRHLVLLLLLLLPPRCRVCVSWLGLGRGDWPGLGSRGRGQPGWLIQQGVTGGGRRRQGLDMWRRLPPMPRGAAAVSSCGRRQPGRLVQPCLPT